MLLNVSYKNNKIAREINDAVGEPFSWKQRFKMRGIGSSKLIITESSEEIYNLLNLDGYREQCNIEMRPKGIILGFRSLLESYALIIPYNKLVINKDDAQSYTIYKGAQFVKIEAKARNKATHKFIKKVKAAKAAFCIK